MTPQRVTLITLGVADLAAARAFYARLGWQEHGAQPGVAFFQMQGSVLGLFGLAAFFWALRKGQFEDLDGAAARILIDDEDEQ